MAKQRVFSLFAAGVLTAILASPAEAQVGRGILDLNAVPEATLATMPGMSAGIAKAFVAARPFATIVDANTFLLGQKVTQEQLTPLYEKAFVHINLNTATGPEILLVPRIAKRMTREFEEYRPWRTFEQFDREIGKYVDAAEVARLKSYVFIPLNLNTATNEMFQTIPNLPGNMLREFQEYKPWKTKEQFDREISKYVGAKETARLWRFMVIN
jgi:DNA uptake protein ComE-like DNA-binding protein